MSVTESERHELFNRVEEVLGEPFATTLMSMLPPVGWADVATKHDLSVLEQRLDARFEVIEARFEVMEARFDGVGHQFDALEARLRGELSDCLDRQTKVFVGWMLGGLAVVLTTSIGAMALPI